MTYEQLPDEWKEWLDLSPLERFRESEKIFAQYLSMGGSLDPDPDPTSPFYDPSEWGPGGIYGNQALVCCGIVRPKLWVKTRVSSNAEGREHMEES